MVKAILVIALTACATGGVATTPRPAPQTAQLDSAKMQSVEQEARFMGVRVVWVNPPLKR